MIADESDDGVSDFSLAFAVFLALTARWFLFTHEHPPEVFADARYGAKEISYFLGATSKHMAGADADDRTLVISLQLPIKLRGRHLSMPG